MLTSIALLTLSLRDVFRIYVRIALRGYSKLYIIVVLISLLLCMQIRLQFRALYAIAINDITETLW